ncbi:MAG: hypothetical protein ACP5HK_05850 [Acidilobus sp.]
MACISRLLRCDRQTYSTLGSCQRPGGRGQLPCFVLLRPGQLAAYREVQAGSVKALPKREWSARRRAAYVALGSALAAALTASMVANNSLGELVGIIGLTAGLIADLLVSARHWGRGGYVRVSDVMTTRQEACGQADLTFTGITSAELLLSAGGGRLRTVRLRLSDGTTAYMTLGEGDLRRLESKGYLYPIPTY